jgi:hypothetical protein
MSYSRKSSGPVNTKPNGNDALNSTGSTINKGTPVSVDAITGNIDLVDISDEISARSVFGICFADTLNGNQGFFIDSGRIENISVAGDFGDTVYISKTGGLTVSAPTPGINGVIEGDFCISLGVICKNRTNPLLKDLLVDIEILVQL